MGTQFVRLDAVRSFELAEGVSGQPLFGEGAMLNLIRFEPSATVPPPEIGTGANGTAPEVGAVPRHAIRQRRERRAPR